MIVSLPENKYVAWTNSVKAVLVSNKSSYKELEPIIDRMIHVGIVMPQIHRFISSLRDLLRRTCNRRSIKLTVSARRDLDVKLFFLEKAKAGIDMNL